MKLLKYMAEQHSLIPAGIYRAHQQAPASSEPRISKLSTLHQGLQHKEVLYRCSRKLRNYYGFFRRGQCRHLRGCNQQKTARYLQRCWKPIDRPNNGMGSPHPIRYKPACFR
jgi:hypothetical protein